MNADIVKIMEKADAIEQITSLMAVAVIMARDLQEMYKDGILSVDRTGVHMTEAAMNAIPWGIPVFTCEPHSPGWVRQFVMVDGVKVYCLVEATDADKSV